MYFVHDTNYSLLPSFLVLTPLSRLLEWEQYHCSERMSELNEIILKNHISGRQEQYQWPDAHPLYFSDDNRKSI